MRSLFTRGEVEATLVGLVIGIVALLLDRWLGSTGLLTRTAALLIVGGGLCALRYWLLRPSG